MYEAKRVRGLTPAVDAMLSAAPRMPWTPDASAAFETDSPDAYGNFKVDLEIVRKTIRRDLRGLRIQVLAAVFPSHGDGTLAASAP
jgi:hypothetical protein